MGQPAGLGMCVGKHFNGEEEEEHLLQLSTGMSDQRQREPEEKHKCIPWLLPNLGPKIKYKVEPTQPSLKCQ